MEIKTISEKQYQDYKAICDKAHALIEKHLPKGGVVPDHVANHPDYKACTNEMRGKVEQYELLHDTPEQIFAYIGTPLKNGMGCDRIIGQSYPVTVWTGDKIGMATKGSSWRVNSYMGTHLSQFYARINGREYTGRGFGAGMYIRLKETAESKRKRA